MDNWALVVHGGAKEIKAGEEEANRKGCHDALAAGAAILENGGTAMAAVEAAIRVFEADPTFNAGRACVKCCDGKRYMDASIMDGEELKIGAVASMENILHPITAAARLMGHEEILLVGPPAYEFALKQGVEELSEEERECDSNLEGKDTVGCVALDSAGHIAAGVSTGGVKEHARGRVGDSPMPGCGFYADDRVAALCCSGDGEEISRSILAARILIAVENGEPLQSALQQAFPELERIEGTAGAILLDPEGNWAWEHNTPDFVVGYAASGRNHDLVYLGKYESGQAD